MFSIEFNSMWTIDEEKVIKENHGKKTLNQILKLLNNKDISYSGFRSKVQSMGLFRDKTKVKIANKNTHNTEYWATPTLINTYYAGLIAADCC